VSTEREALQQLIDDSIAFARCERRLVALRKKRNESIRMAMDRGLSDRVVAIASSMQRSNLYHIIRRMDEPKPAPVPVDYIGTHAINSAYPCCGVGARFSRDDAIAPLSTEARYCHRCNVGWAVSRTPIITTDRGRVDELVWSRATPDDEGGPS
jgi:hypothetical protein